MENHKKYIYTQNYIWSHTPQYYISFIWRKSKYLKFSVLSLHFFSHDLPENSKRIWDFFFFTCFIHGWKNPKMSSIFRMVIDGGRATDYQLSKNRHKKNGEIGEISWYLSKMSIFRQKYRAWERKGMAKKLTIFLESSFFK